MNAEIAQLQETVEKMGQRIEMLESLLSDYDEMQNRVNRLDFNLSKDGDYTKTLAANIIHLMRKAGVVPTDQHRPELVVRVSLFENAENQDVGYRVIHVGNDENGEPNLVFSDVENPTVQSPVSSEIHEEVSRQINEKFADAIVGTAFHVGLYTNDQ